MLMMAIKKEGSVLGASDNRHGLHAAVYNS